MFLSLFLWKKWQQYHIQLSYKGPQNRKIFVKIGQKYNVFFSFLKEKFLIKVTQKVFFRKGYCVHNYFTLRTIKKMVI